MKRPSPKHCAQKSIFNQPNNQNGKSSNSTRNGNQSLKEETHQHDERNRAEWLLIARRIFLTIFLECETASVHDVREILELPDWINPKMLGAVPSVLLNTGVITKSGFTQSRRPETHARILFVWRLVNQDAAHRWLKDNPGNGGNA